MSGAGVINKLTRETLFNGLALVARYRQAGDIEAARKWLQFVRADLRSLRIWGWKLP
jgi:hypothetical protein